LAGRVASRALAVPAASDISRYNSASLL